MARTARFRQAACDAYSVLDIALRRRFGEDGVIDEEEMRILRLSRAASRKAYKDDRTQQVLSAGDGSQGIDSKHFRRLLREYDRDFHAEKPSTTKAA